MASPLTTTRNKYFRNRKSNDIKTPLIICRFLYTLLEPVLDKKKKWIVDVGCGDGRLINGFLKWKILGIDIKKTKKWNRIDEFLKIDFLKKDYNYPKDVALVIFNPPFNNKASGRKLVPEIWLRKVFEIWGDKVPVCMFVPMGFRLNQRIYSKRWRYFRDDCKAEITSIISFILEMIVRQRLLLL